MAATMSQLQLRRDADLDGLPEKGGSSSWKASSDVGSSKDDGPYSEKGSTDRDAGDEKVLMVNGEPDIRNGVDVSRFLVDVRDDEDPPFTFRSIVLGTIFGGLGAALYQVLVLYGRVCFNMD